MLLHPRFEWNGGGQYPIGFEIKRPCDADGLTGAAARYLGQAVDYANSRFHSDINADVGLVYVCVSNIALSVAPLGQLFGQLGVGYLGVAGYANTNYWEGLTLRVSWSKRWSARGGVASDKWSAQRKVGSR